MTKIPHKLKSLIIAFILLGVLSPAKAQSVELTDRFRIVIQKLVEKQIKHVVFKELTENDPILAASSYDLIGHIISWDSTSEIKQQLILSTFDYIKFLSIREYIKRSISENAVVRYDGKNISKSEHHKILSLTSLLTYQHLAEEKLLVVSDGISKIISEYTPVYAEFKPIPGYPKAKTFDASIRQFMETNKTDILRSIRHSDLLKSIVVSLSIGDTISDEIKKDYEDVLNKKFPTSKEFLTSIRDTVRAELLALRNEVNIYSNKEYADLFAIMAPYANAIIFQKIDKNPIDYGKQLLTVIVERLENIYGEKKTGFKYKLGLWTGLFIDGDRWDPPSTSYPIFSLRINDRIQYTFADPSYGDWFVYLGGFSDILIKELSNTSSNQFGFLGLGVSVSSFSFAASATIPVNRDAKNIGFVVSMMHDLPVEDLFK